VLVQHPGRAALPGASFTSARQLQEAIDAFVEAQQVGKTSLMARGLERAWHGAARVDERFEACPRELS
jgi:hypothetical protein